MSLRPLGTNMWDILTQTKGKAMVAIIPKDTVIPPELILCHEHGDHFSLQTAVPATPKELNNRLTKFLEDKELISKEDYFNRFPVA